MNMELLLAPESGFESALEQPTRHLPFSEPLTKFVAAFSERVLVNHKFRRYPDLVALAFWMRPAHLKQLRERFESETFGRIRIPRGLVFHLAPANVDTLFAYSLLLSLLLGNRNIVRLSRRDNPVQKEILSIFRELLQQREFAGLADHLLVVRYNHDEQITTALSDRCDCRVIWGGDQTVQQISALPLPPTSTEIKFANKWSMALISAEPLLQLDAATLEKLAQAFINDCYWYGQAACSSPRIVFWRGHSEKIGIAQERFWPVVEKLLPDFDHRLSAADFVSKLAVCCEIAASSNCTVSPAANNLLTRVQLSKLSSQYLEQHCSGGMFFEANISNLTEIRPLLQRQIQTLTCFGIDQQELLDLAYSVPEGIDRIVPIGQALDFNVIWDGYNLFEELTRSITVGHFN